MDTSALRAIWPGYEEERFYEFLKHKYQGFAKLQQEALQKRKAADKMPEDNPLYQRAQVSAEMAELRVDMAAVIDRNNRLEQMIETIDFLHQRVGVLEGAYGMLKMLAESAKFDYSLYAKDITQLKKELRDVKAGRENPGADGAKG